MNKNIKMKGGVGLSETFYEKRLQKIKNRWERIYPSKVELFTEQYLKWGFCDEDTWDLDYHLVKLTLP